MKNIFPLTFLRHYSRPSHEIFNRELKQVQKAIAARSPDFYQAQYLKNQSIKKIISTLSFINRKFDNVLDLGSSYGHFEDFLTAPHDDVDNNEIESVKQKIKSITMVDSCEELLQKKEYSQSPELQIKKLCTDEENLLHQQLQPNSFDCIVSNLSMHWINNLPFHLQRVYSLLKERDAIFIGSMFTQDTLFELRSSLQLAELERKGGLSPHVSPFVTVQDLGNLMGKAGFKMITIDVDELVIDYPGILSIFDEMKLMGENNCLFQRESLSKDTILAAEPIYKKLYGVETENGTAFPATYRMLFFIGWRDSEIKSAKRGSQSVSLKDAL